jgi:hypothetical protein
MATRTRLTPKERAKRDTLILDLFVAGNTQQAIGAHPQIHLTEARVNQIIAAELDRCAQDHILRNTNAMTIYMARMEHLVRKAMGHVDDGDLKAIEVTRRLMADQAKIYDLVEDRISAGPVPPMSDNELDDVDGDPLDELSAYRAQRRDVAKAEGT